MTVEQDDQPADVTAAHRTCPRVEEPPSTGGLISGDTRVALVDGRSRPIADFVQDVARGTRRTCRAVTGSGTADTRITFARRVPVSEPVLTVLLDTGETVHCTDGQAFLRGDGVWVAAVGLRPGDLLHPAGDRSPVRRIVTVAAAVAEHGLYEFNARPHPNVVLACGVVIHE